jgi:hypothetical protein
VRGRGRESMHRDISVVKHPMFAPMESSMHCICLHPLVFQRNKTCVRTHTHTHTPTNKHNSTVSATPDHFAHPTSPALSAASSSTPRPSPLPGAQVVGRMEVVTEADDDESMHT